MSESTKQTSNEAENDNKSKPLLCVRFFAYFKIKKLLLEKSQIEHYTGVEKNNNPLLPIRYCQIIKKLEYYGL